MSLTNHTKKRTAHARTNPVPFTERKYSPKKEFARHMGVGLRKVGQLISEGRIRTVVVDNRRLIDVPYALGVFEAGAGVKLSEPTHLAAAKTKGQV